MDEHHTPGTVNNFVFGLFIEILLGTCHCLLYILELLLFHVSIDVICTLFNYV